MKYLLLIFLTPLIFSGCHKYDSGETNTPYPIQAEMKSQEFKKGSFWIFQNDSTFETDCTYIVNVHTGSYYQYWGLNSSTTTEYYDMFYFYTNTVNGQPYDRDRIIKNVVMRNPVPSYNQGMSGPVIYRLSPDPSILILESIQVGNNTFYNVQMATIDSIDLYTAKSIGTVKKVIHHTNGLEAWDLIRWELYN